ncbi:MAG: helix-turn-helix transcriptional regulator [Aeromicrobium sp.]
MTLTAVDSAKVSLRGRSLYARALGLNLLKARERRGLSQERLAHAAGISAYTYQKFEKGESRPGAPMNPRLTTLIALCQVLGVTVEEILPPGAPDLTMGR